MGSIKSRAGGQYNCSPVCSKADNMMEKRLLEQSFTINNPPEPIGNYEVAAVTWNMIYLSGQLPFLDGKLIYKGQVGSELTVSERYQTVELKKCYLKTCFYRN